MLKHVPVGSENFEETSYLDEALYLDEKSYLD